MKKFNINCTSVEHAVNAVKNYPLTKHKWDLISPNTMFHGDWHSIFTHFEHKQDNENVLLIVRIPLYQRVVAEIIENHGEEAKKRLVSIAISTKDKKIVKYVWKYIDESSRNHIMAEILGQKEAL